MDANLTFIFLNEKRPVLGELGKLAERNLYMDSNTALIRLGMFGEIVVKYMFALEKLEEPGRAINQKTFSTGITE